jgi:hypothetical protein
MLGACHNKLLKIKEIRVKWYGDKFICETNVPDKMLHRSGVLLNICLIMYLE